MRIAIFSDIHGNRHALKAVLDDIDREAPDRVYCGGRSRERAYGPFRGASGGRPGIDKCARAVAL